MTARALALTLCLATTGALAAQPPETAIARDAGQPAMLTPGQPAMPIAPGQAPRVVTQPAQPAQPRTPTPAPAPQGTPAAAPRERRDGQPVNIRVDVTISDQRGAGAAAAKKTVSVVTADGLGGFIRSQANYVNIGEVPLNVDTEPFILADGKIRVRVNLQYELPALVPNNAPSEIAPQAGSLRKTSIHENLSLILENGKPIVAAQSADPVGDRQVTIEVKATILK